MELIRTGGPLTDTHHEPAEHASSHRRTLAEQSRHTTPHWHWAHCAQQSAR